MYQDLVEVKKTNELINMYQDAKKIKSKFIQIGKYVPSLLVLPLCLIDPSFSVIFTVFCTSSLLAITAKAYPVYQRLQFKETYGIEYDDIKNENFNELIKENKERREVLSKSLSPIEKNDEIIETNALKDDIIIRGTLEEKPKVKVKK